MKPSLGLPTPASGIRFVACTAAIALIALDNGHAVAAEPIYRDPTRPIEMRVQDLLGRMTLEEKVAQLHGFKLKDLSASADRQGNFTGGPDAERLALGAGTIEVSFGGVDENYDPDLRGTAHFRNSLQKFMRERSRLGIPVLVFAEALHGYVGTKATRFPQAIALGSTWDPELAEQVFTVAGLEASARGVRQVLSPVLDLAREPRWGRFEECYGEDPYLVAQMGMAAIFGLQGRADTIDGSHVAVTLKHFAGHGQPESGNNFAPVAVSELTFRRDHLYPFEMAVKRAHAHSVMASYNERNGVPNHASHLLLTEILRDEWGMQGYVMSDGGGMNLTMAVHHVAKTLAETGVVCLEAGVDYELAADESCFADLATAVKSGRAPIAAVDRAVSGILWMKFLTGLFDHPYVDEDRMEKITNTPESRALARRAAEEAMILLKNEHRTLPFDLTKIKTLAVIGPNAGEIHLGDYTAVPMEGISVLQGLRDFVGNKAQIVYAQGCKLAENRIVNWLQDGNPVPPDAAEDSRLIDEAVKTGNQADAIVLVLGENEILRREAWSFTHLGDRDTLDLPGRQHELARAVLALGKPTVVLLLNGGPLTINNLQENAPAIIEGWYLGQETGPAVANVLFGRTSPSGKLTVTFPRSVGQIPCYYDRQPSRGFPYAQADSTPLYPFGFGLSYTEFSYQNLRLSAPKIPVTGSTTVSVDVANTGSIKADEIVQLYVHSLYGLPVRPVLELKDFKRVTLAPGETRTLTFAVTPEKLESYDSVMKRRVQPGEFEILVGRSSADTQKVSLLVE